MKCTYRMIKTVETDANGILLAEKNPAYEGCYVLEANSTRRPIVVDRRKAAVTEDDGIDLAQFTPVNASVEDGAVYQNFSNGYGRAKAPKAQGKDWGEYRNNGGSRPTRAARKAAERKRSGCGCGCATVVAVLLVVIYLVYIGVEYWPDIKEGFSRGWNSR